MEELSQEEEWGVCSAIGAERRPRRKVQTNQGRKKKEVKEETNSSGITQELWSGQSSGNHHVGAPSRCLGNPGGRRMVARGYLVVGPADASASSAST